MTLVALGSCLALAIFLALTLLFSSALSIVWRLAHPFTGREPACSRAAALFLLRLIPSGASLVIVLGVFAPAFYIFEPRGTDETIGPWLGTLAAAGGLLILAGIVRAGRAWLVTRRLARAWLRASSPAALGGGEIPVRSIPSSFPVVSVVGMLRPTLFISDRVLDECTGEELAAIVSHERGHLAAADNLKRLAVRLSPDLVSLLPFGRAIERRWYDASEDAADDHTVQAGGSPMALASALVRVARMAAGAPAPVLPTASLYRGHSVERRVRRLLAMRDGEAPSPDESVARSRRRGSTSILVVHAAALLPFALAATMLLRRDLLQHVHRAVEAVMQTLA